MNTNAFGKQPFLHLSGNPVYNKSIQNRKLQPQNLHVKRRSLQDEIGMTKNSESKQSFSLSGSLTKVALPEPNQNRIFSENKANIAQQSQRADPEISYELVDQ